MGDFVSQSPYPIRAGSHYNTAFACILALDYARASADLPLELEIRKAARRWYGADRDAPLAYEPSLDDFLSPSLVEAVLMQQLLDPAEFGRWLNSFLPSGIGPLAEPPIVADRSDAKQSAPRRPLASRARGASQRFGLNEACRKTPRGSHAARRWEGLRRRALARQLRGARAQRGSSENPMRNSSTERAHCRPSRIAHTTSDWPRRMSPAANTFGTEVT